MENDLVILKALADDSRLRIIKLLLQHNFCVRALARQLDLSEAAVSQHLKVLREAGLLTGEKKGYFTHYTVNQEQLTELSGFFSELASIEKQSCKKSAEGGEFHGHCHGHEA